MRVGLSQANLAYCRTYLSSRASKACQCELLCPEMLKKSFSNMRAVSCTFGGLFVPFLGQAFISVLYHNTQDFYEANVPIRGLCH